MKKHGVVPDVCEMEPNEVIQVTITTGTLPLGPDIYRVTYPSGAEVKLGNELTPLLVKDQPQVSWTADSHSYYTLCMIDPDAPSRRQPKFREWHHWLVSNIPGQNIKKGDTLTQYVGAGPPKGTGLHRYVFLVFKQPEKLTFDEPRLTSTSGQHRGKFSIMKFADKYKLGHPVAGNLYQAQYDDYVPKLHKQLSGQ